MGENWTVDLVDFASKGLKALRFVAPAMLSVFFSACGHFRAITALRDPLSAEEHLILGSSYEQQGLIKDAAQQFRKAVRLDPTHSAAWMALGNRYFNDDNFVSAEKAYKRALKLSTHNAGANNNLAMVYLKRNMKLAEAEEHARTALRQDSPLKPYILDTVANIYLRQRRFAEAEWALDEAEAAAPAGDTTFLYRLSETRRSMDLALLKP